MLHIIKDINDELLKLIKDDPVRPEISLEDRVNKHSQIYVLLDDETGEPTAVTCVKFLDSAPKSVQELYSNVEQESTAVFYTIWSYTAGAGRKLIQAAQSSIKTTQPTVTEYVTLSPKTEMAERFHLKNGADKWRVNEDSVNYRYE
jgi:hypothetical protein